MAKQISCACELSMKKFYNHWARSDCVFHFMSFVLAEKFKIFCIVKIMTRKDFMLMRVEHEKSFIILGQIR